MEQFIIILLVLIVSLYVSYPYFFSGRNNNFKDTNYYFELLEILVEQKELYLSEIKDIEFDYGLGKLSDKDYQQLLQEYKLKAASVIEKIEKIKTNTDFKDVDEKIEKEILAFRKVNS